MALGTIGQDYFDIDLFPYEGSFPLGDAYRLELGVDFGAGPHRFTLFFIPPRTKLHDHPPMTALLCAGAAEEAIARRCKRFLGRSVMKRHVNESVALAWSRARRSGEKA